MRISSLYDDVDNLDHDPALAAALGNLVIVWANAESALVFAFSAITDIPVNMAIMGYYRIPTFEARTKMLRAMIEEWKTTKFDKSAIYNVIEKLNRLSKTRNDWIHGVWSRGREENDTVIFDFRAPEGNGRRKTVTASAIINHLSAVRIRTKELRALLPGIPP